MNDTQQQLNELKSIAVDAWTNMKLAMLQWLFNYIQSELNKLRVQYLPEDESHV